MIGRLTKRSLSARKGRSIILSLAIVIGVAFVSASFILSDSLNKTFSSLFADISKGIDLQVRGKGNDDGPGGQREQIDISLRDQIAALDGVSKVQEGYVQPAPLVDKDGELVPTAGPAFGQSWDGTSEIGGVEIRDGRPPSGPTEAVIDKTTATREKYEVGDTIRVQLPDGVRDFTLVGTAGLAGSDGFAGASIVAWDPATTDAVLGIRGKVDSLDIAFDDTADATALRAQISALLPATVETVSGDELVEEATDAVGSFTGQFRTGLLIFAGITLFVSAFIINNVFSITIGQRLRELALMRAVGASGRQVRWMIAMEALAIAIIATLVGMIAAFGVAMGLIAVINNFGGFPEGSLVFSPRTALVATIVGIGVTMASVIVPSRKASRIPPVAAMRPETGFTALASNRRAVIGSLVAAVGAGLFALGLFAQPGGTLGTVLCAGGGVIMLFLGVSSLAATFARPVSRLLGAPLAKLFKTPGHLARENAARAPRRTAATATALTIGVALVTAAALFGQSVKATAFKSLDTTVQADFFIRDQGFQGFSTTVRERMDASGLFSEVSPVENGSVTLNGESKAITSVTTESLSTIFSIGITGDLNAFDDRGLLIRKDIAATNKLAAGDTVKADFDGGKSTDLTVVGTFERSSVLGETWLVSESTWNQFSPGGDRDGFLFAQLADGVEPETARSALIEIKREFPIIDINDQSEIRDSFASQINTLLNIITILLAFAFIVALIGIAITLALSVYERTREIGLMRAVGMDRKQVGRMVRGEAVIVTVFGAIVGVVLGLGIGIMLCKAVPDDVIDTLAMPTATITIMLVVSVVAGVVAAIYPAIKASRMNVLDALATA